MRKLSFSKLLPKGSVLVFSLLILSIMLVTSLTILSSALLNQKAALSTGSSGRSFQVADSGVERVLYQIYKQNNATLEDLGDVIAGGSTATVRCNNGVVSFPVSGGDVKVGFYQDDPSNPGNVISYTNCAGTDWRDKVVKIKSEGTAGTTSRAGEVAVAAAGDTIVCAKDIPAGGWQVLASSGAFHRYYQFVAADCGGTLPTNAYVGVLSGLIVGGGYATHAAINTGEDTTAFSYTGLSLSPVDGPGVFMSTLSSGSNNAAALRAIYIRK